MDVLDALEEIRDWNARNASGDRSHDSHMTGCVCECVCVCVCVSVYVCVCVCVQ